MATRGAGQRNPTARALLVGAALVALAVCGRDEPDSPARRAPPPYVEVDGLRYLLYVPPGFAPGGRALAVIHGTARAPMIYLRAWTAVAEREQVVLVVPRFDETDFADYAGLNLRGRRADLALNTILADVARRTGADVGHVYLFGFSAGAQFAHRYALAHPDRVARVVVASPGAWTQPDPERTFPRGVRRGPSLPDDLQLHLDAFLALPLLVLVGAEDPRVEPATAWHRAMVERGAQFELAVLPGVGHQGTRREVTARAAAFLFQR